MICAMPSAEIVTTSRGPSLGRSATSAPPPRVAQDLARGVVAGHAGDAAAGMRAGAAHVESANGRTVVAVAEHRTGAEQLIERERAVEDIATRQAEVALH